jgi:hypothetical protein
MQFRATVLQTGATTTGIAVPEHVLDGLGSGKRPKVTVSFNGYSYRTTVGSHDGGPMISVSSDVRAASGVSAGDEVEVTVELDTAPREIEVPEELAAALAGDPEAKAAFDALSNSKKQQLTLPVAKAKAAETKARNVEKALKALRGE